MKYAADMEDLLYAIAQESEIASANLQVLAQALGVPYPPTSSRSRSGPTPAQQMLDDMMGMNTAGPIATFLRSAL